MGFKIPYDTGTHETKTKLDEKRWKNIKTYTWTVTSKELLIEALSNENIKNEILGFELNNITENQDGVDEATGKLTQILHSISDKACKTFHKSGRKKKKKYSQPWSDNVIYETKREINSLGNKIKHNPNNNVLKQKYFTLCKNFKKMVKQKKIEYKPKKIMPPRRRVEGHINLPPVCPFVPLDIDTWFVRLSPRTVVELQL